MRACMVAALIFAVLLASCSDESGGPHTDSLLPDAGVVDGPPVAPDTGMPDALTPDAPVGGCEDLSDQLSDYANYQLLLACLRDDAVAKADKWGFIDTFVKIVEAAGGFPIVEQDRVVFVYVRGAGYDVEDDILAGEDFSLSSRNEPIRVAGSFNDWDVKQHTLKRAGLEVFHAEIALDVSGKERHAYRFIARDDAGADVWFSDPLSRRYDFDHTGTHPFIGRYSIIRGGNDASGAAVGHLEHIRNVHATQLTNNRPIYIYVPRNYDHAPAKRYPVLYMHDGGWCFDPLQPKSWSSLDVDGVANKEIAAGHIKELIVVGIPPVNRYYEYSHTQDKVDTGNGLQTMGGGGKAYLDFIVNDLKPLVDAQYRTNPGRDHTAIMGASLGGLISYYAGLMHPTVFKYVGGMSSSFWWGQNQLANPTMGELYQQDPQLASYQQVYYLDSGDDPANPNPPSCLPGTPNEDNYCDTVAFRDMLVSKGIDVFPTDPDSFPLSPANVNIYYHHEPDALHHPQAWRARLYRPLRLFFAP